MECSIGSDASCHCLGVGDLLVVLAYEGPFSERFAIVRFRRLDCETPCTGAVGIRERSTRFVKSMRSATNLLDELVRRLSDLVQIFSRRQ